MLPQIMSHITKCTDQSFKNANTLQSSSTTKKNVLISETTQKVVAVNKWNYKQDKP